MATWPNVDNTNLSTQDDEYILFQNGINYVQNTGTLAGAIDQGEWVPTFDYELNTVVRGSDKRRYVSIQESGPNKGGSQDPTSSSSFWYDCTDVLKGKGKSDNADKLDGQHGSYYQNASNLNSGTIPDARLPETISSDITGNAATASSAADSDKLGGQSPSYYLKRQATQQEALDGDNVDAYMPPDLVHAAFNQYGYGLGLDYVLDDLNEATTPGNYFVSSSTTLNSPFLGSSPAILTVSAATASSENDRIVHFIHGYSTNNVAWRSTQDDGDTWTDWEFPVLKSNKATTEQAQVGTDNEAYLTPLKGKQQFDHLEEQVGVGQSYQDVTSSRQNGVTYTNNTEKPIFILVKIRSGSKYFISGYEEAITGEAGNFISAIIPVGGTYKFENFYGKWMELR